MDRERGWRKKSWREIGKEDREKKTERERKRDSEKIPSHQLTTEKGGYPEEVIRRSMQIDNTL